MNRLLHVLMFVGVASALHADEPISVWPDLAPGETSRETGEILPFRADEVPPVTRVVNITCPTFTAFLSQNSNGTGVVILPGGGFQKVVPDKEGAEAALWLNRHGISAFVLNYRTKADAADPGWLRPLQDAQRTLAMLRAQAMRWDLKPDQIGLLGFSAGGQVAARLLSDHGQLAYERLDEIDDVSHQPDFAMLVYPWNIYDSQRDRLVAEISVNKKWPPTFLVHTDDDKSSSLGAAYLYGGLKRHGISAELHIYGNGGHGYGIRAVEGSQIASWTEHATHWLRNRQYASPSN